MTERRKRTSWEVARNAGGLPNQNVFPTGFERPASHKELHEQLQVRSVTQASTSELLELLQYLRARKININQKTLQKGQASFGYEKRGVIVLEQGQIGIRPNQNNIIYSGTPQQFLDALRTVDNGI